jgi:hypothetical protein
MKKTFILQTDVCKGILAMLDNEKAGILFRLIVDYVSGDKTLPVDGEMRPTGIQEVDLAFAIVRAGLDSNQRSYEDICEARREAGRKGAKTTNEKKRQSRQKSANAEKSANIGKASKNGKIGYNENKEPNGSYDILYNKKKSSKEDSQKETDVSFSPADLVVFFNSWMDEGNAMIPRIKSLSEQRKKCVGARIREYGKPALSTVISKAAASDFLNGKNGRDFIATFDWLMKPTNFPKVLEGNYDNHEQQQKAEQPKDAITTDSRGLVRDVINKQREREEEDRKRILETYQLAKQGDAVSVRLVEMMRQSGKLAKYGLE